MVRPSAPITTETTATPYTKTGPTVTAEVVNGMNHGQTLYIRKVERSCMHQFSLVINALVIIATFGMAIGQLWGLALKQLVVMEVVMRTYLIAISGMIILNELEVSAVLSRSPILQKFTWRGMFYSFVGTLACLLNDIGNDDYYNHWNKYKNNYSENGGYVSFIIPSVEHFVEMFIVVTSWLLLSMGVLYIFLGLVFAQHKIENDIEEYRTRLGIAEQQMAGEQDVMRRRFGGRLGEEIGMA